MHAENQLTERTKTEKNAPEPIRQLGKVKGNLARLAAGRGQLEKARALINEAIEIQQKSLTIDPHSRLDRDLLADHRAFHRELAER